MKMALVMMKQPNSFADIAAITAAPFVGKIVVSGTWLRCSNHPDDRAQIPRILRL